MITADFQITNAGQMVCVSNRLREDGPRRRETLAELAMINGGALAAHGGQIVWVGRTDDLDGAVALAPDAVTIDAKGAVVTPGLVDPHTHPVFAAWRHAEFEMRAMGKTYKEIAAAGGGIKTSVAATRDARIEDIIAIGTTIADNMLRFGTTTAEAKGGYGLSRDGEIKLMEAIRHINQTHAVDWVPTALPAHDFPPEYVGREDEYVALIVDEILPAIAERKLAEFNDVFFETGVFDRSQTEIIQTRARELGMGLKFHADELSDVGGAQLAAEMGAISADHLVCISESGVEALAGSGTIAILLPGTAYYIDLDRRPPARMMIDSGVAVALATDCNPGSNLTESMPLTMNQACVMYKMSPAEALVASTLNAAWAVNRADSIGSLTVGKKCDVVIWDCTDYRQIAYHYGVNLVRQVVKNGTPVG